MVARETKKPHIFRSAPICGAKARNAEYFSKNPGILGKKARIGAENRPAGAFFPLRAPCFFLYK